jgi:hypothetical protein
MMRTRLGVLPITLTAVGVWMGTFLPGAWDGIAAWIIRATCIVLWVWLAAVLYFTPVRRPALAAPLFLITTLSLWFYLVIPICFAVATFTIKSPALDIITLQAHPWQLWNLIGSQGELATLRFSVLGISVSALMVLSKERVKSDKPHDDALPSRWLALGFGVAAAGSYALITHLYLGQPEHQLAEPVRQVGFIALVVYAIATALAAVRVAANLPRSLFDVFVLITAAVLILPSGLKAAIYILGASGIFVALARRSFGVLALALTTVSIIFILGMSVRFSGTDWTAKSVEAVPGILAAKIVARQVESVNCLSGVIRKHSGEVWGTSDPLYFVEGLVPRFLWPEKPDISKSGRDMVKYCDPVFANSLGATHSASATILWEPLAFAGSMGQIVSQTMVFLMLAGLSRVWINSGPYAGVGVLTLSPWTLDFDQHFALYVANLTKAGLITVAFLLLLACGRRIFR